MRYCVKVFNTKTGAFVGYYKQIGKNSLSSMISGAKWYDTYEEASNIANELDDGFIRDKDKHYYTAFAVVYGDSSKQPPKQTQKTKQEREEELSNALETFIRKNSNFIGE